jgi:site-specific recombinase XerD
MFGSTVASAADGLLDAYAAYLRSVRGVTALTIDAYVADARRFLSDNRVDALGELTAVDVSRAVLEEMPRRSPATVRRYGVALRSFLRYCYLTGLVERDLSAAALPVCRGAAAHRCRKGSLRRKPRRCWARATGGGLAAGVTTR